MPLSPFEDLLPLSTGDFVRRQARLYGPRTLARFQDGEMLSYEGADAGSERFGAGLRSLGVAPGDRVGLLLANSARFLIASYGLSKAGGEEIPLHTELKGEGLVHVLAASRAKGVIAGAAFLPELERHLDRLPALEFLVVAGGPASAAFRGRQAGFDEVAAAPLAALPAVGPTQTSAIMFTSGTTGTPKGVVRSHRSDLMTAWRAAHCMGYEASDVIFSVFPLTHVNAKYNTLLGAMHVGGSAVLHAKFSASRFWDSIREHGATSASFQGAMLEILWKARQPRDRDNPLRSGRAAPVPAGLHRDFEDYFGLALYESYGATEAGIIVFNRERRPGCIGRPVAQHYEVRVLDPEGRPVPAGEPGMLVVRERVEACLFSGYLDRPEDTARALRDGWLHTGDLVTQGEDGMLAFVTRRSEAIRRRGENISPQEVEEAVAQAPGVLECAAYGVPSELTEEEVMVAVVADPRQPRPAPEDIARRCAALLPRFAVPRYIRFVAEIPRTDSQRTRREALRREGVTPDTWQKEAAAR